ncbi:uncharacterized protein V1518DRAFT_408463 [Limtongia smithiae]|uniref:uncharacterized protein n=1 Tax=Limtongia smithiae TaxID=1125753 RepID=UPI0034CD592E
MATPDGLSAALARAGVSIARTLPFAATCRAACVCALSADVADIADVGRIALELFLQQNFTGPRVLDTQTLWWPGEFADGEKEEFVSACVDELSEDSEIAYAHVELPHVLLLAVAALQCAVASLDGEERRMANRWLSRAFMVHQAVLGGPANTLHDAVFASLQAAVPPSADAEYDLELARACVAFSYDVRAREALERARATSGFRFELTGMKALKTRYQTRAVSSLVVLAESVGRATSNGEVTSGNSTDRKNAPSVLDLNSDLLLEAPKFNPLCAGTTNTEDDNEDQPQINDDPNNPSLLSDVDYCILLMTEARIRSSSPAREPLVMEQLLAYIARVVNSNKSADANAPRVNWTLFSRALWERSTLEAHAAKTVERGTLQMASLVEELGADGTTGSFIIPLPESEQPGGSLSERLRYVHCIPLLPRWQMDVELATQYLSLGMVRSAQEVYERLRLPIENALCTAAGGDSKEAESMLRAYIAQADTPRTQRARAWSCLGDITQNPEDWNRAWDEAKYASAKRSLGQYYYANGDIAAAITHLADALSQNALHRDTWFLYGCAGLAAERYDVAAEGFTRCVAIDSEDGRAWSNLATALMRMPGRERESISALEQACRLLPEEWRVWSNLSTAALQVHNWPLCMRATTRLVELRGGKDGEAALDLPLLRALAQALVARDRSEGGNAPMTAFERSGVELFTDLIPRYATASPDLWELVAKIELWRGRPWDALAAHEKMLRAAVATLVADTSAGTDSSSAWDAAVEACVLAVDAYINLGPREGRLGEGSVVCSDWNYKARSAVRTVMSKGRKFWEDTSGWERLQALQEELKNG